MTFNENFIVNTRYIFKFYIRNDVDLRLDLNESEIFIYVILFQGFLYVVEIIELCIKCFRENN